MVTLYTLCFYGCFWFRLDCWLNIRVILFLCKRLFDFAFLDINYSFWFDWAVHFFFLFLFCEWWGFIPFMIPTIWSSSTHVVAVLLSGWDRTWPFSSSFVLPHHHDINKRTSSLLPSWLWSRMACFRLVMVLTMHLRPCIAVRKQDIILLRHVGQTCFSILQSLLDITARFLLLRLRYLWFGMFQRPHSFLWTSLTVDDVMDNFRQDFFYCFLFLWFRWSRLFCCAGL